MSLLDKPVSYFRSVTETTGGIVTSLLTILKSDKHKVMVQKLRLSCHDLQKKLKNLAPCYTVAGTFHPRSATGLIRLSGLAAVDLDIAEKYDSIYLLNELKKIPSIAYAGHSISGSRLFCIVPLLYPNKYNQHYERLIRSFTDMGLPMGDECHKSISQPRFVTWNDKQSQFFNHNAVPYNLLPSQRMYFEMPSVRNVRSITLAREKPFAWCMEQFGKSHSFQANNRHAYVLGLARYCNIKGVPKIETLAGCLSLTEPGFSKKEISDMVDHVYTKQANSHNKLPLHG